MKYRLYFFTILILLLTIISSQNSLDEKISDKVLEQLEEEEKVNVIVKLKDKENSNIIISTVNNFEENKIINKLDKKIKNKFSSSNAFSAELTREEVEYLLKENYVEKISYNYPIKILLDDAVNITNATSIWPRQINFLNLTGVRQSVCVIDTGVNYSHPDLGGCSNESFLAGNCSKIIGGYDFGDDDHNPMDYHGHGTHVAGIVGASGGISGIAPNVSIVAMKVFTDAGLGNEGMIISAIDWCVNNASAYNITVITMSIGLTDGENSLLRDSYCDLEFTGLGSAIDAAVAQNISVIVSSGNDGNTTHIGVPACIENAIPIASSTKSDGVSSFSNRNNMTQLFAPGESINSTGLTEYSEQSGTSMAAPMVAGAIAILNQFLNLTDQLMTPQEIETTFNQTGVLIDDTAVSGYNFSQINIYSAILSLDVDAPNVTLVSPTDNKVNLTNNQTFTCNATDWQLANLTLYVWNSTGLYYNETKNLTGTANETSFNLTNMGENTYSWNCLATDMEGKSAYASSNFSLTIGGISVNLLSPSNQTYTNSNNTNFSCQVLSDVNNELENVTFYLWNYSGDLIYNLTENISGFDNTTVFNYTFINEGSYNWNCLGVNNNSNKSLGENNFSVVYDVKSPNLTLISLPSSATSNSISKTFSFNVSEDNLANCSLIIGGTISLTNSSINTSITQSFSQTFTPGTYIWKINCSDFAGNVNSSDENSFTITAPLVVVSSSGGGGGSATTSTPSKVYEANVSEISAGYTKNLKSNEKINFSIFDFEGGRHLLTINEISTDYVNLLIESDPINLTLGVGQSVKLNLTSKIYYDLFIKINKIIAGEAELTIQLINEPIEARVVEVVTTGKIEEVEPIIVKDYSGIVTILTVLFILIGLIILKLDRKELKPKKILEKKKKKRHGKKRKKTKS
ncbi:MAG: S8 family serine peptidase [Nanoarchaeota archaeon]|nr:S8 family serine peptidase [Nanoarchaeota archaeon]